jgi:ankyrin repeat protein
MGRHLDTELFREARNASGSLEHVRELIAAGADVNRRHKCGNTPLWEAAFHGRADLVAELLAAGANPNIYSDDGSGPLHWAAQNGFPAVAEQLLAHGADPNALRLSGQSILAAAIDRGDASVVRRLVEAGAAVDHRYFGRSMPEYARYCGRPDLAVWLYRWRRMRPVELSEPDPAN